MMVTGHLYRIYGSGERMMVWIGEKASKSPRVREKERRKVCDELMAWYPDKNGIQVIWWQVAESDGSWHPGGSSIQEQVNWHPGWKKAVSSKSPRVRQNI